jgi:spore germination protein GerM
MRFLPKITSLVVLSMVPLAITSCTQRTILHGGKVHTPAKTANAYAVWLVQADDEGLKMVPVRRPSRPGDKLKSGVEALLAGPSAEELKKGLGSEIPRGTVLIGMDRKGSNVELNLSKRFALGGGASSFETRLLQLSRTVTPLAGRDNVYLSVEGKRLDISPGEGIEIKQPINR